MDEILQKLIESELLSEETVEVVRKALAVKEQQIEDRVRKQFTETYRADRDNIIRSVEKLIEDRLRVELTEFADDRQNLRRMTAKAARAVAEAEAKAKNRVSGRLKVIEAAIAKQVTEELREFSEDRRLQRESFMKQAREVSARAAKDRVSFIKRGAAVLESIVEGQVRKLMTEYKQDILEAKQNNFGRVMFEAYAAEYRGTFFNESAEAKKLAVELAQTKRKLRRVAESARNQTSQLSAKVNEALSANKMLSERNYRNKKVGDLLSRLDSGKAKRDMKNLLESVPTDKLEKTFARYLSEVAQPSRRPARKSSEVYRLEPGNGRLVERAESAEEDVKTLITDIKRRAAI